MVSSNTRSRSRTPRAAAANGPTVPDMRSALARAPPRYRPTLDAIPQTTHIILVMWSAIIGYSLLVSALTGGVWWEMLAHYAGFMISLYAWHWQAHRRLWWVPYNAECFKMHMEHHFKTYPPDDYFGVDGDGTTVRETHTSFLTGHEMLLYVLLLLQLAVCAWLGEARGAVGAAFAFVLVAGYTGNFLHQAFHVRGHWCERFAWFHELRAFHYIHHQHSTRHNYSVMNVGLDWLFGSLVLDQPPNEAHALERSVAVGGLSAMAMGLQPIFRRLIAGEMAWQRGLSAVLSRLLIVGVCFALWFEAQVLVRAWAPVAAAAVTTIDAHDLGHAAVAIAVDAETTQRVLVQIEYALVGALGCMAIGGHSLRPAVAVTFAMAIREALVLLGAHCVPAASAWNSAHVARYLHVGHADHMGQTISGFAVLLVVLGLETTHRVHTHFRTPIVTLVALVACGTLAAYTAHALLALRAVWTADLVLGAIVGRYAFLVADSYETFYEGLLP